MLSKLAEELPEYLMLDEKYLFWNILLFRFNLKT